MWGAWCWLRWNVAGGYEDDDVDDADSDICGADYDAHNADVNYDADDDAHNADFGVHNADVNYDADADDNDAVAVADDVIGFQIKWWSALATLADLPPSNTHWSLPKPFAPMIIITICTNDHHHNLHQWSSS